MINISNNRKPLTSKGYFFIYSVFYYSDIMKIL